MDRRRGREVVELSSVDPRWPDGEGATDRLNGEHGRGFFRRRAEG
jgi:hypothetical protein